MVSMDTSYGQKFRQNASHHIWIFSSHFLSHSILPVYISIALSTLSKQPCLSCVAQEYVQISCVPTRQVAPSTSLEVFLSVNILPMTSLSLPTPIRLCSQFVKR